MARVLKEVHESGTLDEPLKVTLPWKPEYRRLAELGEFSNLDNMFDFALNYCAKLSKIKTAGLESC